MFIIICPTLPFDLEHKLVEFAWNIFLLLQIENAKWVSEIIAFIGKRIIPKIAMLRAVEAREKFELNFFILWPLLITQSSNKTVRFLLQIMFRHCIFKKGEKKKKRSLGQR